MSDSWTVLRSQGRCRGLRPAGEEGVRLELLFGGPHLSEPSFSRFGVRAGDRVYPLHVRAGVVYVPGSMRVREIVSLDRHTDRLRGIFGATRRTRGYRIRWSSG